MLRGLFVTGTDTGVGKTVVAAALLHRYQTRAPLRYWKPIQTGTEQDDDTAEVRRLTITGPCPLSLSTFSIVIEFSHISVCIAGTRSLGP